MSQINNLLRYFFSIFNFYYLKTDEDNFIFYNNFKNEKISFEDIQYEIHFQKTIFYSRLKIDSKKERKKYKVIGLNNYKITQIKSIFLKYQSEKISKLNKKLMELQSVVEALWSRDCFLRYNSIVKILSTNSSLLNINTDYFWNKLSKNEVQQVFFKLKNLNDNIEDLIRERNELFIENEVHKFNSLFDSVEKNPLVYTQRRACVVDEENNLILAGAGSGKTSIMVARCAYLLETKKAKSEEILLLAFNKTAAKELEERARKYLNGATIQAETFHSLGLKIVSKSQKEITKVSKYSNDEDALKSFISTTIINLLNNNRELMEEALESIAPERLEIKSEFDFNTENEYLEFIKNEQIRTLNGELVKSYGELEIANYLFKKGIKYSYETPYKIKTSDDNFGQYVPDFYLEELDIYIEYFGLDKDGNVAHFIDKDTYNKSIEWKRTVHKANNTRMIELFYHNIQDGVLLERLSDELLQYEIKLSPEKIQRQLNIINDFFENIEISDKILSIMNLIKTLNVSYQEAKIKLEENQGSKSDKFILKLTFEVIKEYSDQLSQNNEIDFGDMISKAIYFLKNETFLPKWKYILVDEFQDISMPRAELIKLLKEKSENCSLFCVGDDWQAIYHFAGSKSELVRNFKNYFGYFWQEHIDTTFRFNDKISSVASRFVMENPLQIRKNINSIKKSFESKVTIALKTSFNSDLKIIDTFLRRINVNKNENKTVLFLHKENIPLNVFKEKFNEKIRNNYPDISFNFLTYHKSKGLEADYVIALNMVGGKNGFPSDEIFQSIELKINPLDENYQYSEERRIFYVILTRAKEEVLLLSDIQNPSVFVTELINNNYEVRIEGAKALCPQCKTGFLVEKSTADGKRTFLGCTRFKEDGCKFTKNQ